MCGSEWSLVDDIGGAEGSQSVQHDTSTGLSDLCASGIYGGRPPEAGREAVCQDAVEQAAAPSFASILARAPPRQREVRHLATQDKLLWVPVIAETAVDVKGRKGAREGDGEDEWDAEVAPRGLRGRQCRGRVRSRR